MLKEKTLREIIFEGKTSGKKISKKFECEPPTLIPITKKLREEKLIHLLYREGGKKWGQEKFFRATAEGIDYFLKQNIDNTDLTLKQFFTAIFYAYDKRYDPPKIEISDLFSSYKEKHSKIKEKIYPIYTNPIFDWTRKMNLEWLSEAIRVIELFKKKEYLTADEIYDELISETSDNYTLSQHSSNGKESDMLLKLKKYGLITQIEDGDKVKFRITVFGLLILFRILYKNFNYMDSLYIQDYGDIDESYNNLDEKKYSKDLEFIQKTYCDLLPKILSNWKKLVKVTKSSNHIVSYLILLFFVKCNEKHIDYSLNGTLGLFELQKAMGARYYEITENESNSFLLALKEWGKLWGLNVRILGMITSSLDNKLIKNMLNKFSKGDVKGAFYVPKALKFFLELDAQRISTDDFLHGKISIEKAVTNKQANNNISETIEFQFFSIVESVKFGFEEFLSKTGLQDWFHGYKEALYQFGIDSLKERKNWINRTLAKE